MLMDASCRQVDEIRNLTRGGNPRELQNWDTAAMRFDGREYNLRIGGEGSIGVNYFTRVQWASSRRA